MLRILGVADPVFESGPVQTRYYRPPGHAATIRYDWRMPSADPSSTDLDTFFEGFDPKDWPVVAESNQGRIMRVRAGDFDLAVKTPRGRGIAWKARRYSLHREYRAYRRIDGVPGFPRCFGLFGGCYLAMEYVDGALLKHAAPADPERFFDELKEAVTTMHERGVVHGDLKSRQNVMVTAEGRPMIIDLGTAVVYRRGWHPLNHWLFGYLRQIDLNGWIKLKYGSYDRVDELDRHMVRRSRIERINNWARRRGL